jgi:P-type Cu2+ transporter
VPAGRDDAFCCTGCQYVFNLLQDQGLDQFYDLKGGKMLSPVSPDALRERDYEWLESLVEKAEAACPACEGQVAGTAVKCAGLVMRGVCVAD